MCEDPSTLLQSIWVSTFSWCCIDYWASDKHAKFRYCWEFLVDHMTDPGTLIPADVLSAKDAPLSSVIHDLQKTSIPGSQTNQGVTYRDTNKLYGNESEALSFDNNILDKRSKHEKAVQVRSIASSGTSSITVGSSSSDVNNSVSEKLSIVPSLQNAEDYRNLLLS